MSKGPFPLELPSILNNITHLNDILEVAAQERVSDVYFMGGDYIWANLHNRNVRVSPRPVTDDEIHSLLEQFYGAQAQSLLGSQRPIDTSHEMKVGEKRVRVRWRVNVVNCERHGRKHSITMTFRLIPTTPPSAADLGIEKGILDVCADMDQGMIAVVGATGQGKSTLMAAILRGQLERDAGNMNLVTIEAPIEFVYDDVHKPNSIVTQLEVGTHVGSFGAGVENSLRMHPTTILVGESRDLATVEASMEASMTGHTVFTTVHANSVSESFRRLMAVFPEGARNEAKVSLMQTIRLSIAQRLVPSTDGKLVALREYLHFDQALRNALISDDNFIDSIYDAIEDHGQSIMKDAMMKYRRSTISRETFNRVRANYESGRS